MVADITDVPFWFNILVYINMYQYYILVGILASFYLVIVKFFGFPLFQQWNQEVVLILYPTKVKFAKLTSQYQSFFAYKKGCYWTANPLINVNKSHKYNQVKGDKSGKCIEMVENELGELVPCGMTKKEHSKIENKLENNLNMLHVFVHSTNQEVFAMDRRKSKLTEILDADHKVRTISSHGVWLMKNPLLHFHRHWKIIIGPEGRAWQYVPVKQKQQYSINLWHTLGIEKQSYEPIEEIVENEGADGGNTQRQQLVTRQVTNQLVVEALKHGAEYQNFSANATFRLCKALNKIEKNFSYWIQGTFNILPIVVVGGAVACVVLVMVMFHGGGIGPMPTK